MSQPVIDIDALANGDDDPIDTAFASEILDALESTMREQFGDTAERIAASFPALNDIRAPSNKEMLATLDAIVRNATIASGSGATLDQYLSRMAEEMMESISSVRDNFESTLISAGQPWRDTIESALKTLTTTEETASWHPGLAPIDRETIHRAVHDHIAFALQPSIDPERNSRALRGRWRRLSTGDKIATVVMLQGFVMILVASVTLALMVQQGAVAKQQLALSGQQFVFERQSSASQETWQAAVLRATESIADLDRDIDRKVSRLLSRLRTRARPLVRDRHPAYVKERRSALHP